MTKALRSHVAAELASHVAAWTGYRHDAIRRDVVEQVVRGSLAAGATVAQLYELAHRRDPALVQAVVAAVSVGETFFFRQPEHFRWIARAAPRFRGATIRAWSAGCATGEEAYSLAACLADCVGPRRFDVLGTDFVNGNVERARAGKFGNWSMRTSTPLLFPVFGPSSNPKALEFTIEPEVRSRVRFEHHNLLDAPPPCEGGFHIILCRNVLLYFSPEHARATAARLATALAPNGVLIFGALDVSGPPDGFCRLDPPELNIFQRAPALSPMSARPNRASARTTPPVTRPSRRAAPGGPPPRRNSAAPGPRTAAAPAAIGLHRRALLFIERGQRAGAERLLAELRTTAPDYLPGILEQGLFYARAGDHDRAAQVMREVTRRCEGRADETVVPGPETLSIEYYRRAARAYQSTADRGAPDEQPSR